MSTLLQIAALESAPHIGWTLSQVRSRPWITDTLKRHPRCKDAAATGLTTIYFIQGAVTRLVKVGRANCVASRMADLQQGSPDELILLWAYLAPPTHETQLHWWFASSSVRGEWFTLDGRLEEYLRARIPGRNPRQRAA